MNNRNDFTNVVFEYLGNYYNIVVKKDILLSNLFEIFRNKIGEHRAELRFYDSLKRFELDPKKRLLEIGNKSNYNILVVQLNRNIGGDCAMNFTDLSKQIIEEIYFSSQAPSYRKVSKGINICGKCKCRKCPAFKKEVVVPKANVKEFNLIKERYNIECPECGSIIASETLCFYLCEYKIKGRKIVDTGLSPFEFSGKASKKECVQYFSPNKNGEATFADLTVEIINYL
jgi:hypothetical protein